LNNLVLYSGELTVCDLDNTVGKDEQVAYNVCSCGFLCDLHQYPGLGVLDFSTVSVCVGVACSSEIDDQGEFLVFEKSG
jgi:hypothetical protein